MTTSFSKPTLPGVRLQPARWHAVLCCLTAGFLLLMLSPGWAQTDAANDPPGSVARLNLMEGSVRFLPAELAGSGDANAWTQAVANRPLTTGDRLWSGPGARAELHVGSIALRMNEKTGLDFHTLDDDVTRMRLDRGTLRLRVRTLFEGQRLEIDTPNLAFVVTQPGDYRIDASPASATTRVVAQSGGGIIYGDSGMTLNIGNQQQGSFSGTNLTPATPGASVQDSFDDWTVARDQREDQSVSARYLPREIVGYQQLDTYGDWGHDPGYGAVWMPRAMPANWAPYRAGHWSWISPWGWTWIDDAPWGFAPFHYGRWAQIGPRWAWVPGRLGPRPVYAPALVSFIGGGIGGASWRVGVSAGRPPESAVGWFPLAPGEAFLPAYRSSPHYVNRLNNNMMAGNVVNNANNVNNYTTNIYRYQRQPSAVTSASAAEFARGQPGRGGFQAADVSDLGRAPIVNNRTPESAALLPPRPERPWRPEQPAPATGASQPLTVLPTPRSVTASPAERHVEQRNDRREAPRGQAQRTDQQARAISRPVAPLKDDQASVQRDAAEQAARAAMRSREQQQQQQQQRLQLDQQHHQHQQEQLAHARQQQQRMQQEHLQQQHAVQPLQEEQKRQGRAGQQQVRAQSPQSADATHRNQHKAEVKPPHIREH